MKVNIRHIKSEGVEVEHTFSEESIGLTGEDSVQFSSPIKVRGELNRTENEVIAKVTANSCYESFCGRCLVEVKQDWATTFTLAFDVDSNTDFIEMGEDIRQELILNLPTRIVCSEDCKGLCIDCGVNLNNESCACMEKSVKKVKVEI